MDEHNPPDAVDGQSPILWRLCLRSPRSKVYEMISTDVGREQFWCERSRQSGAAFEMDSAEGSTFTVPIRCAEPPERFAFDYLGERTEFTLADDRGGTRLTLVSTDRDRETHAGWVSVLMALKAAADHGVDLRNHNEARSWNDNYVDN